jgi:hypothetical protein
MHRNWDLKLAVLRSGRPQYQLARELGWSESRLSRAIRGVIPISAEERVALHRTLGLEPEQTPGRRPGAAS